MATLHINHSYIIFCFWRLESGCNKKYADDPTKNALHCDKFGTFWMAFEFGRMRFGKGCTIKTNELSSVNISYNGSFDHVTVIGLPENEPIVLRFNGE